MAVSFEILKSIVGRRFGIDKDGYWGGEKTLKDNVTVASTGTVIEPWGVTSFGSTAAKGYSMSAPVPGVEVLLACTQASTGALQTVTLASGTFDGTNHIATFNAAGDNLFLKGLTTSLFAVVGNTGSVALSTV